MRLFVVCLAVLLAAAEARAQTPPPAAPVPLPATICNLEVPPPAKLPPAGTGPYTYIIMPCFEKQGGVPVVDANTYLYYMEMVNRRSIPSENRWVPYNDETEQTIVADFKRLWATSFLDDLSIEVRDVRFENGVIGKVIVYNMEERQRVKIVDYIGSDKVDQSKIEEALRDKGIQIRLDTFIDPGLIRRVAGVVREQYAGEGYMFAEVKPTVKEVAGTAKTVHVTFNISEGPKVRIRDLEFVGNEKVSDRTLAHKMKENGRGWFTFLTGGRTYKEEKFGADAEMIIEHYRDNGYIAAQVGQPDLKVLEDEEDGKTRWVQLRVPITEGDRYKIGEFSFEGNTVVKAEALKGLFKFDQGEYYSEKKIKKSLDKAREVYGAGGYYEFVAYPDLKPRNIPAADGNGASGPPAPSAAAAAAAAKEPAVVDVTMKVTEGKQYFVNRITFTGNTTTRDNVIRREIRLLEAGVFNTEALKYSIKRLNQLGYFKALEGDAIQVEKTPGVDNKVDLSLKLEEQNRNQLTFGAGVSQFDGFFGQLSFQTSNFLGRGETFSVTAQQGNRAKNYQVAFTEPFLFDRPMTAGVDLYIRADPLHRDVHAGLHGRQSRLRVPDGSVLAGVRELQPGALDGQGPEPALQRSRRAAAQSVPAGLAAHRTGRQADHQQGLAELGLQHGRPADLPDQRHALHVRARRRRARRQHQLPQAADRGHLVHPAQPAHLARLPRRLRLHPPVGQHAGAADLRAAVSRRRIQHPRLRHPHRRAARSGDGHRARRHQEPAVQRGVPDQHRRAGAPGAVRRRRPGARLRPAASAGTKTRSSARCRAS